MNKRQNQSQKQEKKIQYSSTNKYSAISSPKYGSAKIIEQNISPNNKRKYNKIAKIF